MEHPAAASRRKLQKVYAVMYAPTRARLKAIAGLEGVSLLDLMDTILTDYVRGWEKLHKIQLDKMPGIPQGRTTKSASKAPRKRSGKRPVKRG